MIGSLIWYLLGVVILRIGCQVEQILVQAGFRARLARLSFSELLGSERLEIRLNRRTLLYDVLGHWWKLQVVDAHGILTLHHSEGEVLRDVFVVILLLKSHHHLLLPQVVHSRRKTGRVAQLNRIEERGNLRLRVVVLEADERTASIDEFGGGLIQIALVHKDLHVLRRQLMGSWIFLEGLLRDEPEVLHGEDLLGGEPS